MSYYGIDQKFILSRLGDVSGIRLYRTLGSILVPFREPISMDRVSVCIALGLAARYICSVAEEQPVV